MSIEKEYEKFKESIDRYQIIPEEFNKIILAMSGGKDIGTLATLLLEYKERERPDLQLEMIQAPFPDWLYFPDKCMGENVHNDKLLIKQNEYVEKSLVYWTSKGYSLHKVQVQQELYTKRIMTSHWPCIWCFTAKTKAMIKYIEENQDIENALFAYGWLKWDIMFALITHLLKSDGTRWEILKDKNPEKYLADCRFLLSFSPYPKVDLGFPNKKIIRIQPLIEFNDVETNALSKKIGFPVIPDICKDLYGSRFEQDRRNLSKFLKLISNNQSRLKLSESAFLFNYRNMIEFLQSIGILPPIEELEGRMYSMFNSDFDLLYEQLKYQAKDFEQIEGLAN